MDSVLRLLFQGHINLHSTCSSFIPEGCVISNQTRAARMALAEPKSSRTPQPGSGTRILCALPTVKGPSVGCSG